MEVYPCNEKWEAGFGIPPRRDHVQTRSIGPGIVGYGSAKSIIPQKFVAVRRKLVYKNQFNVSVDCKGFCLGRDRAKAFHFYRFG